MSDSSRIDANPSDPTDDAAVLVVNNLTVELSTKTQRREVLKGVSFTVQPGRLVGIVGQTGSGKSITLRSVLGLLPTGGRVVSGDVFLDGTPLFGLSKRQLRELRGMKMSFIPQQPIAGLNPIRPIERQFYNVFRSHEKCSYLQARVRATELLQRVGIQDPERVLGNYAHELSGGIAQRIVIAIALSLGPRLILADEPTTALDVTIQREILDLLRKLCTDDSLAMVLVTHDLSVVANYCDEVVVLHEGRVVEAGRVDEVLTNPKAAYTQRLLAAVSGL